MLHENIKVLHGKSNMKFGDIVCVKKGKKSDNQPNETLQTVLKDYLVEINSVFSTQVYDISFIDDISLEEKHNKKRVYNTQIFPFF